MPGYDNPNGASLDMVLPQRPRRDIIIIRTGAAQLHERNQDDDRDHRSGDGRA